MTILYMEPVTYNRLLDHLAELDLQPLNPNQSIRRIPDTNNYNENFHLSLRYKDHHAIHCEWFGGNLDIYDPPAEIEDELVVRIAHLLGLEKESENSYREIDHN